MRERDLDAVLRDTMIGPGGKLVVPESESKALAAAITKLMRVAGEQGVNQWAHREIWSVIHLLKELKEQVAHGYHRNPAQLVVYGNPPLTVSKKYGDLRGPIRLVGAISGEAHAILYRHSHDGKQYRHDFEHPTSLIAVERAGRRDVIITSPDGDPIWQNF